MEHNTSLLMEQIHFILDVKVVKDATFPTDIAATVLIFCQVMTLVKELMTKISMPEMTFLKSLLFDI